MKLPTTDILVKCGADRAAADRYVNIFNELLPYYKINSLLRLSNFLAQLLHESDRLRATHEYDSGAAYEFRMDLGNTMPGDGIKYKGRGGFQVTGKINYAAFARRFGIDCVNHPELLEEPRWWVASALWYWGTRSLNLYADKDQVYQISCLINIGHVPRKGEKKQLPNGWNERQLFLKKCKVALAPLFNKQ